MSVLNLFQRPTSKLAFVLATMASLVGAGPAAADPAPGVASAQASWAAKPPPKLPDNMIVTLDRFSDMSRCIATRRWDEARPLFDTRIDSPEQEPILRRITGGAKGSPCAVTELMRLTTSMLRGGIAEARYRYVYGNAPPPPPFAVEVAPAPERSSFIWVGFNQESGLGRIHGFATCLAEREPGGVHALLMTRWGSKDERTADQALSRRFGECLRPNETLKANSLTLRPWLAEALYQNVRRVKPDV
jgi:hypothetical protein